jgi:hypothetical protein
MSSRPKVILTIAGLALATPVAAQTSAFDANMQAYPQMYQSIGVAASAARENTYRIR